MKIEEAKVHAIKEKEKKFNKEMNMKVEKDETLF